MIARIRAEFAGLRPTRRAHNLAGLLLAAGAVATFWLTVTAFFPWCTA